MSNKTFLTISDTKLFSLNPKQEGEMIEKVYATFSSPVNASLSTIWNVMLDKVENPKRYNPEAQDYKILERRGNQVLREMKALGMTVKERITWDEKTGEIRHTLVNNPLFIGQAINAVIRLASNNPNHLPIVTYTVDWEPYNDEARKLAPEIQEKLAQAVTQAVLNSKTVAEQKEAQKKSSFPISDARVEATTTNDSKPMLERFPGTATDIVKRLFLRGEAFDADGFTTFFTDTPVYQFSNFDVCLDKAAIKKSTEDFFNRISAIYHEIKMLWQVGDVVFVEMDVTYWRKDGSVISLPCCDIFRLEGDKFSELRVFMDINPLFNPTIAVPDTASVFTVSQGKKLTPQHIMKNFLAEQAEGIKRLEPGFAPKWSINGHNSISSLATSPSKVDLVMEMEATGGQGNWDYFQTFFVEDVYFKVGASQEKRGTQAIRDYLTWLYEIAEPNLPFEFRGTWELEDVVIIEMDAKYIRRSDSKPISFPCADILRFEGNKIREWRVYPDQSELWMNEKVKGHGPRTYR